MTEGGAERGGITGEKGRCGDLRDGSLELAGIQASHSLEDFKDDHELKFEEPIYLQGFSILYGTWENAE